MSNLSINEQNGILVVDSRLVAIELGINHGDWFKNIILKYQQEIEADFGVIGFENGKPTKGSKGGRPERFAWLTEDQATILMTYSRNTEQVRRCKRQLVNAFSKAKQIIKETIPAQYQETERIKLELELTKAKQHYQETGRAIALSTSPAMLAFIRGETPLPPQVIHRDRFIDPTTGKEVDSAEGRSLTQLIANAGLNPKSTRDRSKVKNILKTYGFDYDSLKGWATASYLREYPVLPDEVYNQALRAVVAELTMDEQPNLFVNQFQQKSLPSSTNQNSPLKPGQ